MKKITQKMYCQYCEAAIVEGIEAICNEIKTSYPNIVLNISVFDVNHAVSLMINPQCKINEVKVIPSLSIGQFTLIEKVSGVEYIQDKEE